jgi:hypothetical protein
MPDKVLDDRHGPSTPAQAASIADRLGKRDPGPADRLVSAGATAPPTW